MLYQSMTAPSKSYKYVVCLSINGIENVEIFDTNGTALSKYIRSNVKQHICNSLQIPEGSITDFSTNVFLFNYCSHQSKNEIIKTLINYQHKLDSSIELQLIVGISSYKNDIDQSLSQKKALYDLQFNKLKKAHNERSNYTNSFENAIHSYELELLMPKALNNNEFQVVYQPIVGPDNKVALEALLRWTHEEREIPPNIFIPIAERSSQIYQLTYLVIRDVIQTLKKHPKLQFISINLAPVTLDSSDWLFSFLDQFKDEYPEIIRKICWEITEGTKLSDEHWNSIKKIRNSGHRIFIDDFGEGHTSFHYLLKNIDTVKIDKSFLQQQNKQYKHYLNNMIQLCLDLNLNIILEGIETKEELEALQNYNSQLQGYYISKPIPKKDITSFINTFQGVLI